MHHAPLAKEGGVSGEGMEILATEKLDGFRKVGKEDEGGLSKKQWAVVRYTDEMTRSVRISDEVFGELRQEFNEKEVVEITATVRVVLFHYLFP